MCVTTRDISTEKTRFSLELFSVSEALISDYSAKQISQSAHVSQRELVAKRSDGPHDT
jgi:hypothetical protein